MQEILQEYFINPIIQRSGYNIVNTAVYAAIALVCLYLIWRFLKSRNFDFAGKGFLYGTGAFVLFGSTARVLTDLADAGAMQAMAGTGGFLGAAYSAIHSSAIFDYGFLTVTPGTYIVTAILFLLSIAIGSAMKNRWFAMQAGLVLWLPCFLLLIPFMEHFGFFLLAIGLAVAGSFAAYFALEKLRKAKLNVYEKLAILGQGLDGAATFVIIDLFAKVSGKGYFEQHVLSAGIGSATPLGYGFFFFVKLALASLIVYFLAKEKMDSKDVALILIVVAIMGFAPGIRDILRMLVGS